MYIVILAGGSGTRFWPLSRSSRPKQLISISGDKSMLQKTVDRVLPLKPKRILIITNKIQAAETRAQLGLYHGIPIDVIAEPTARNTAAAIGLAAVIIHAHDPSGTMVVLPADHFIRNEDIFCNTILRASQTAAKGYLVTLGIVPTHPETGYGYIEAEMELRSEAPFPVRRFVEKPPLEKALQYLEDGNFFWNSGMFIWRCDIILAEIAQYLPDLAAAFAKISFGDNIWELADLNDQIERLYETIETVSIDYGVMEKSSRVQILPVEMGWSDVGSWSALPDVVEPDAEGTVCINATAHIAVDSADCLIYTDNKVVATVGVSGLVIVSTPDALLVCDRKRAQDVKKVVESLADQGLERYL